MLRVVICCAYSSVTWLVWYIYIYILVVLASSTYGILAYSRHQIAYVVRIYACTAGLLRHAVGMKMADYVTSILTTRARAKTVLWFVLLRSRCVVLLASRVCWKYACVLVPRSLSLSASHGSRQALFMHAHVHACYCICPYTVHT